MKAKNNQWKRKFKMKRVFITWIILILCKTTFACTCIGESSVKGGMKYSHFVFTGTVIKSERVSLLPENFLTSATKSFLPEDQQENYLKYKEMFYERMKYTFEVSKIYKGNAITDTLIIYSGFGNGDCGYTFQIGDEYIVYASWNTILKETDFSATPLKFLETNICTRTQPFNLEESTEIERFLVADTNERTIALDLNETVQTWIDYYKSFDKDFTLNNFVFEQERAIDEMQGNVCGIFDECFDQRFAEFLVFSPNKKKYVDMDTYGMLLTEDNEADFEVDQEVNVVDIEKKSITRIFFLGSHARVEDVFWKNDSMIVLLINVTDYFPEVAIFDIITKKMEYYEYRSIVDFNSDYYYERLRRKGVIID